MKDNSKREIILEAAKNCFKDKGFYGSGMDEIAKKAGITKSLLYYYFKSKDDIFIALLEESLERLLENLSKCRSDDLRVRFENLLENIKKESDVLTIGLVDMLMEDTKTNVIMELSKLEFSKSEFKNKINEKNRLLYVMFIMRAIMFFSLKGKISECFGISARNAELINKEDLFNLYKKINEEDIL